MKNKKKLTIAAAGLLAVILAVAGIAAAVRTTTSSKVLVVPVSDLNYGALMDWENSVSGMVTGDAIQAIYLSDTETVESVMVKEGQSVHKGDVLLKYDTKATRLNLEKEKINREKILLDLEVARKNLETLENTSPTSDGGDDFGFDGDFDEFEDTEIYENAEVYVKKLTADAKPVNGGSEDSEEEFILGTEEDPYIFLVDGDSIIITRDFIRKWQKIAKKNKMKQLYFAIEKRDKNYTLLKAWETDVMLLDPAYDIEVDLSTGKTTYSGIKDPADMAKLLRKVLKDVPEDERGLWLAVLLDKLAITTEKEDKLKERGELLASAVNELNTEDREELAAAASKLDELALATLLSSLTSEQIQKVDADVISELFTKMLECMTETQIQKIDTDILESFLSSLTADQLRSLAPDKVAAILSAFGEEELEDLLNSLPQDKKNTIQRIVEKWKAQEEQEEEQEEQKEQKEQKQNTADPSNSVEEKPSDETESNTGKDSSRQESESVSDGEKEQESAENGGSEEEKTEEAEPAESGGSGENSGSDEETGNTGDTQSTEITEDTDNTDSTEDTDNTDSTETEESSAPEDDSAPASDDSVPAADDNAPAADNASSASSNPSSAPEPEDEGTEDIGGDTKGGKNASGLLSPDLEYTSSELEEAKREQRDAIKSLELDLRESDIKIRQAERALEKGTVTASMNGVVKSVGDPAAPPTDGSAFLTVAGADGLYIKSGIKESLYGTLQVGDMVTVASWQSGSRYEAEIKSISPYPENGDMFGGDGETYYPFTAGVSDENAVLENGEYVEVTYNASSGISSSGGALTIMKPFVREEGSKKYVFMRDGNMKLKKQYIKTGTLSDNGYEVLSGITESDWVAFPYGKNVKEGAKTYEGSPEELYNY